MIPGTVTASFREISFEVGPTGKLFMEGDILISPFKYHTYVKQTYNTKSNRSTEHLPGVLFNEASFVEDNAIAAGRDAGVLVGFSAESRSWRAARAAFISNQVILTYQRIHNLIVECLSLQPGRLIPENLHH